MGRWEVGFLQVGAWVFIGWYVIVNLVHCGYLCGGHGRSTELALQRSWYHRLLVGKVKRRRMSHFLLMYQRSHKKRCQSIHLLALAPRSALRSAIFARRFSRARASRAAWVWSSCFGRFQINLSLTVLEGISDMSSESRLALTNLLLQRVSKPSSAATLCAAAAPSRADRPEHCRDQLEANTSYLLINQSGACCAYMFEIS